MSGSRRREREVVAVAFNQKEQRVLEKSLATLRLEASYSLKLLDLHNRTVKVHFRQMKDRVSRIKSHLEPDEIHELRQLEAEGKLQPMYPAVSLGSAIKIAAAARRLNSSHRTTPARQLRAKSAQPRVNLPDHNGGLAPPPGILKRSNSVTGVFVDVPPPPAGCRPGSASVAVGGSSRPSTALSAHRGAEGHSAGAAVSPKLSETTKPNGNNNKLCAGTASERPGSRGLTRPSPAQTQVQQNGTSSSSSMDSQHSKGSTPSPHQAHKHPADGPQQGRKPSPVITVNGHRNKDGDRTRRSSAATSHSRTTTSHSHSHAPFSSHVATEKEAREREDGVREGGGVSVATPRSHHDRTSSFLSVQDDLVDDLGEDLFAERRAELLEEEQYRAAVISRRKDRFLRDIDQYLKDNPPLTPMTRPVLDKAKGQGGGGGGGGGEGVDALSGALFRRRRVEFNARPTYLPEQDYKERLMGLWRDMSKCRYLRVPDERIDLSGINTLATDTMRLFQVLKHREVEPLANAWTE
ncbi:uncharacterized protein LOC143282019 [Babylonia areolata]|uniref:uncharacterized protein LOC143282019 n=1 Tax=Babylonia areolata TaxID=304850 RepID=UPI003FD57DB9